MQERTEGICRWRSDGVWGRCGSQTPQGGAEPVLSVKSGVSHQGGFGVCGQPLSAVRETATGIGESRVLTGAQVALSDSLLLRCMDGTVRDLAALRGTYRLIDKTTRAIEMVGRMLEKGGVGKAVFYLDSPVSNSGRLKERIGALLEEYPFDLQFELIYNVDAILEPLENVITSDAIILDKCGSWFNLCGRIIAEEIGEYPFADFAVPEE